MTRDAFLARFPATALVMTLLGWAGAAHADVFTAIAGNNRVALICEGIVVVDTPCRIEIGEGSLGETIPLRFLAKPTRYAHLLKLGIEIAVENSPAFRLDSSDISLLRELALDKCHPGADSSGDLFQLCIPAGSSSSVVVFRRDACDRCNFQRIILRKQQKSL
jgi:hypothetical protein